VVCRHLPFEVTDAAQKAVEDDFVTLRANENGAAGGDQQSQQRMTAEDLHHLLVLARLLSLSSGSTELTGEAWTRAKEMERERVARMAHLPPRRVTGQQQPQQNQRQQQAGQA